MDLVFCFISNVLIQPLCFMPSSYSVGFFFRSVKAAELTFAASPAA